MEMLIPSSRVVVWALDRDAESLESLQAQLKQRIGSLRMQGFQDPQDAYERLQELSDVNRSPCLFIHDQIAFNRLVPHQNDTLKGLAKKKLPLTWSHLFSESAYLVKDRVQNWLDRGEIDAATRKPNWPDLLRRAVKVCKRWRHPTLKLLRAFMRQCDNPADKYLPDGKGNHLSLIDVHKEIMKETGLGAHLKRSWSKTFAERRAH